MTETKGKKALSLCILRVLEQHANEAQHPGRPGHVPIQHLPGDIRAQGPRHPDQGDGPADGGGGGIDGVCCHGEPFL